MRSRAQGRQWWGQGRGDRGKGVGGGMVRWRNGFRGREGMQGPGQRGEGWTSGLGGVGGRGRASTHGAISVLNPTKKTDFEFFWGREGGSLVGGGGGP